MKCNYQGHQQWHNDPDNTVENSSDDKQSHA